MGGFWEKGGDENLREQEQEEARIERIHERWIGIVEPLARQELAGKQVTSDAIRGHAEDIVERVKREHGFEKATGPYEDPEAVDRVTDALKQLAKR